MSGEKMSRSELLEVLRYFGEKNVGKRGSLPRTLSIKKIYIEDLFRAAADLIEKLDAENARMRQSIDTKERDIEHLRCELTRCIREKREAERRLEYADNPCV